MRDPGAPSLGWGRRSGGPHRQDEGRPVPRPPPAPGAERRRGDAVKADGDAQGLLLPPAAEARRSLTIYPPRARHCWLPRPPPPGTGRRPARGRHVAPCPAAAPGGRAFFAGGLRSKLPRPRLPAAGVAQGSPAAGRTRRRAPAAARHPRARGPRPRPRPLPPSVGGCAISPRKDRSPTSALPSALSAPGRESDTH